MKTFKTLAVLALFSASVPAFASLSPNGVEINGGWLNGRSLNGGSASTLQSMTVYAVTLPDEAQTEAK